MNFKRVLSAAAAFAVAAAAAVTISVSAEGLPATAYLCGAIGAVSVWEASDATAGSTTADIDGDAQYQVEWVISDGGTSKLEFLCVQIPGFTKDQYPDLSITVDEVYVDGNKLADYKTSSKAVNLAYYEGGTGATRLYLIDSWAGTGVADISGDTAVTKSLKVKFTVSGTGTPGTSNVKEEPTEEPSQPATSASDGEETTEPATGGVVPTPTDETEATTAPATDAAVTTVQTTAAVQTTANNNSGGTSGNQVSNSTSNAPGTKDAGVAIAFAGLAVTAAVGVLTQLRKK